MYCKNCGKKLNDDNVFCPYCGTPVEERKQQGTNRDSGAGQGMIKLLLGGIAALLIVVIILLAVLFGGGKEEQSRVGEGTAGQGENRQEDNPAGQPESASEAPATEAGSGTESGTERPAGSDERDKTGDHGEDADARAGDAGNKGADWGTSVLKTDLYTLTIPKSWQDTVEITTRPGEYNDYYVEFVHKASRDANMGGYLFGIEMFMDGDTSYEDYPSYQVIGRMIVRQAEVYMLVATFPTDVQFSDATSEEYIQIREQVDGVIESFVPESQYPFEYYMQ